MKSPSILGALMTAAVLGCGFAVIVPHSPGVYVGVVAAGTFGAGTFYGQPTQRLLAYSWRCTTLWSFLIRWTKPRLLARALNRVGWNRQVRHPVRSFTDLNMLRADATGSLLSHAVSLAIHLLAAAALLLTWHPWWALALSGLGVVLHGWPCVLQIDVLIRVDEIQHTLRARARDNAITSGA